MLDEIAAREVDVAACVVDPISPTGATVILTDGTRPGDADGDGGDGALDVESRAGRPRRSGAAPPCGRVLPVRSGTRAGLPGLFATARASGVTTSLDTNWDPDEAWDGGVLEMLRNADVFLPNAAEVSRIARNDDAEAAARSLAAIAGEGRTDGGPIIVVKQGATGAFAVTVAGEIVRVPALSVDARDATGAGDAFGAGFLRAWLDGGSLSSRSSSGSVCGGLSTRASAAWTDSPRSPRHGRPSFVEPGVTAA